MKTNTNSRSAFSVLLLLFLCSGLTITQPCAAAPFQFEEARPLPHARASQTATLLLDGKVLVAAGYDQRQSLPGDELYDPATGTWTATDSVSQRYAHTATLLPDGRVLVAGGLFGYFLATAELYDPTSGTWTPNAPDGRSSQHR